MDSSIFSIFVFVFSISQISSIVFISFLLLVFRFSLYFSSVLSWKFRFFEAFIPINFPLSTALAIFLFYLQQLSTAQLMVALQCCRTKWISYMYIYTVFFPSSHPTHIPPILVTTEHRAELLSYTRQSTYINPSLPVHPTSSLQPRATHLFSTSASLFLPCT